MAEDMNVGELRHEILENCRFTRPDSLRLQLVTMFQPDPKLRAYGTHRAVVFETDKTPDTRELVAAGLGDSPMEALQDLYTSSLSLVKYHVAEFGTGLRRNPDGSYGLVTVDRERGARIFARRRSDPGAGKPALRAGEHGGDIVAAQAGDGGRGDGASHNGEDHGGDDDEDDLSLGLAQDISVHSASDGSAATPGTASAILSVPSDMDGDADSVLGDAAASDMWIEPDLDKAGKKKSRGDAAPAAAEGDVRPEAGAAPAGAPRPDAAKFVWDDCKPPRRGEASLWRRRCRHRPACRRSRYSDAEESDAESGEDDNNNNSNNNKRNDHAGHLSASDSEESDAESELDSENEEPWNWYPPAPPPPGFGPAAAPRPPLPGAGYSAGPPWTEYAGDARYAGPNMMLPPMPMPMPMAPHAYYPTPPQGYPGYPRTFAAPPRTYGYGASPQYSGADWPRFRFPNPNPPAERAPAAPVGTRTPPAAGSGKKTGSGSSKPADAPTPASMPGLEPCPLPGQVLPGPIPPAQVPPPAVVRGPLAYQGPPIAMPPWAAAPAVDAPIPTFVPPANPVTITPPAGSSQPKPAAAAAAPPQPFPRPASPPPATTQQQQHEVMLHILWAGHGAQRVLASLLRLTVGTVQDAAVAAVRGYAMDPARRPHTTFTNLAHMPLVPACAPDSHPLRAPLRNLRALVEQVAVPPAAGQPHTPVHGAVFGSERTVPLLGFRRRSADLAGLVASLETPLPPGFARPPPTFTVEVCDAASVGALGGAAALGTGAGTAAGRGPAGDPVVFPVLPPVQTSFAIAGPAFAVAPPPAPVGPPALAPTMPTLLPPQHLPPWARNAAAAHPRPPQPPQQGPTLARFRAEASDPTPPYLLRKPPAVIHWPTPSASGGASSGNGTAGAAADGSGDLKMMFPAPPTAAASTTATIVAADTKDGGGSGGGGSEAPKPAGAVFMRAPCGSSKIPVSAGPDTPEGLEAMLEARRRLRRARSVGVLASSTRMPAKAPAQALFPGGAAQRREAAGARRPRPRPMVEDVDELFMDE